MSSKFAKLVAALAFALALGACADASVVATVEGRTIEEADVLEIRTAYEGEAVISGETFRQDLTNLIIGEALLAAAERDFGRTDLDSPASIAAFLADPGSDAAVVDGLRASPDFTDAAVRRQATLLLIRREATRELVQRDREFLESTFTTTPERVTRVCARHILVPSLEEAQNALERIIAGEDFASLASEVSLDTQSPGGQLPCPAFASQYVDGFSTAVTVAPLGDAFGPVQTEFGWHVVEVTERSGPSTLAEFVADPIAFLDPVAANDLFTFWIDSAVRGADIHVDPAVGTWLPEADGILPPPS